MTRVVMAVAAVISAAWISAQEKGPPLSDGRLSVNTLVREDIFAGFLEDDMDRFARGERSIDVLLERRPKDRPVLLTWKGGATLYRAVRAFEDGRLEEYREKHRQALDLFAEARKLGPDDSGVEAATGGSYVVFADRLPKEDRGAAWSRAYDAYQWLWQRQGDVVKDLPTHLRGELLAGLAQSAQRTGRSREAEEYVEKVLELLPDTPYEPIARRWKEEPEAAGRTSIACHTCHAPGRLAASRAALEKE
jgi:tetratricopeptide (TPR) repeat protein